MTQIASTHFFTHIPHPMHKNSEMNAILSVGLTSIHNFPMNYRLEIHCCDATHTFLHSWAHLFGLHRFASTMAIRVILSADMVVVGMQVSWLCYLQQQTGPKNFNRVRVRVINCEL
ncbi:hypothetical protein BD410DRAFT_728036 [Rickenella mellea]|uniref:Uncharacterized protein n=1 Tax=Rickenella mellea TaxID=50990 RepID=A0A4Y7PV52_9AGAM|nr:hypothetical protein BD410DRAFT_728036 [Rickenella mellea]